MQFPQPLEYLKKSNIYTICKRKLKSEKESDIKKENESKEASIKVKQKIVVASWEIKNCKLRKDDFKVIKECLVR